MSRDPDTLLRYTTAERINHWVVAISFILLALSGLALFHPLFWPLSDLLGGGTWSRILHPFIGLLMVLAFIGLFFRFRKYNRMTDDDREWLKNAREVIKGHQNHLPEQGKFNAGQKLVFKSSALLIVLLLLSGLVLWRAYFNLPVEMVRIAAVVHAASATFLIAIILIHVYAAIWVKGSFGAMGSGKVSRAWARQHHRRWYREMTGK
ncbi:MAG TPA: formate dehydrogenase subunit gamma [Gammaproteobacteria bacterium]